MKMSSRSRALKQTLEEPGLEHQPNFQPVGDVFKSANFQHELVVGIAAFNEGANIGRLLESLLKELGGRDQVIVVASGCTDRTGEVVREWASSDPRIRLIQQERRNGKASAVNKILSEWRGNMLLLVSADVLPVAGSIKSMMEMMETDKMIGVVSCRPTPVNSSRGLVGYLGQLYWRLHHRTLSLLDSLGINTHGGEAILVRKGIVSSLPLDCINDDAYIGIQAVRKGFRVRYCPQAYVMMRAPDSLTELIGQRRRVLRGHFKVREHTGHYPRVLDTMILYDTVRVARVLSTELRSVRAFLKFIAAVYIEGISGCLALVDVILGRGHSAWTPALTTKSLEAWTPVLTSKNLDGSRPM